MFAVTNSRERHESASRFGGTNVDVGVGVCRLVEDEPTRGFTSFAVQSEQQMLVRPLLLVDRDSVQVVSPLQTPERASTVHGQGWSEKTAKVKQRQHVEAVLA